MDKEKLLFEIEKRVERKQDAIKNGIAYLHSALNEIDTSISTIYYLKFLKEFILKSDEG